MWKLIVLALVTGAAPQAEVKPLSGPAVRGQLVALSSQEVVLEVAGEPHRWHVEELLSVARLDASPAAAVTPAVVVGWLDGSQLHARGYGVAKGTATIDTSGPQVQVQTDIVRHVRFPAADKNAAADQQWQAIVGSQHAADVLVIRRSPSTLDTLDGVIFDINEEIVEFQFDGQRIPVPRSKIEGLIYYHVARPPLDEPLCRVTEIDGTRWHVASLQWTGQEGKELEVVAAAGPRLSLPWEQIRKLDFSAGNLLYLSDLEPEQARFTEFPQWRLPKLAGIQQLFGFQRDRSLSGRRMETGGQSCDKGLAIHSRTELVYRLPEGFARFRTFAGIDDEVRADGDVVLAISGDGRELYRKSITGVQDPVELNLDITGVRRLTILVDFGEEQDIADRLHLCEARVTK